MLSPIREMFCLFILIISLGKTTTVSFPLLNNLNAPVVAVLGTSKIRSYINKVVENVISNVTQEMFEQLQGRVDKDLKDALKNVYTKLDEIKANLISVSETKAIMELNRLKEEHNKQVKVGLTSCAATQTTYNSGDILQFPDIKTHYGIANLSAFTSTGVFTCEYPGMYLVSATVLSKSYSANFRIYQNSSIIKNGFVSRVKSQLTKEDNNYHTGTSIIAIELNTNDKISIRASIEIEVHNWDSCLTLIRIH